MAQVKPQVIDDEQHERIYERVAAVDVAKDSGMVCTRTPHPSRPGARQSTVWTVKARMVLAATLFAHESATFGVDVPAGLGGDLLLAAVVRLGGCRGCPAR